MSAATVPPGSFCSHRWFRRPSSSSSANIRESLAPAWPSAPRCFHARLAGGSSFSPATSVPISFSWINIPDVFTVPIGMTVDPLSRTMLVVVNTIAPLVFIYSIGYMAHEEGYWRYFAGLALFLFSMLGIVLANNFVMMFIFWELVGLSSYILIGHYYGRASAAEACKQAFIVNRIGDFRLYARHPHALVCHRVRSSSARYLPRCRLLESQGLPDHRLHPGLLRHSWEVRPVAASCLASQFHGRSHSGFLAAPCGDDGGRGRLHARRASFPLLVAAPIARDVIAWVGALTCLAAALMATQQNDIKRILAYSTISQLGYMVLGAGVAPVPDVPMFHLFHARLLQMPALPVRRIGDRRSSSRAGHLAHGRAEGKDSADLRMPYRRNPGLERVARDSAATLARTLSSPGRWSKSRSSAGSPWHQRG